MATPLWASALKGVADLGTVVGNGLAFGRGEDLKQTLGWGTQNTAKALGLMGGDYVPLKNYLEQGASELAAARQNTGAVGTVAEDAAGLLGAGAGGAALLKGGRAAIAAVPSVLPKLMSMNALKYVGAALGAGTAYNMVGSGTTPQDFEPPAAAPAQSSATKAPQPGSKQIGPAAAAQGGEADWSPSKKAFVDLMSSVPLGTLKQAMEVGQIGQVRMPTPRDLAFQRLTGMLQDQYRDNAAVDPAKAKQTYINNMTSVLNPAGVPYMNYGTDQ